jgi:hypothetical protein
MRNSDLNVCIKASISMSKLQRDSTSSILTLDEARPRRDGHQEWRVVGGGSADAEQNAGAKDGVQHTLRAGRWNQSVWEHILVR